MNKELNTRKVSILILVFNRKKSIDACIQSHLYQTYADLEVVALDNGSDDGTWGFHENCVA